MVLSTIFVGLMYVLGSIAVGLVVPTAGLQNNFANGIFDVFKILGTHFGIPGDIMVRLVGVILFLGSLGSLALWTAAPVKVFFSEILQQHGYQTGVVGKWHMQCEPKGFDYYHVLWDQGDYYNPEFKSKESNGKYVKEEGYATTLTTDHAIEFLEERDKDKPFCLLVHHKAPHRNWMPDTKYMDLYEDVEFPYPDTFNDNYATRCDAARTQEMEYRQKI